MKKITAFEIESKRDYSGFWIFVKSGEKQRNAYYLRRVKKLRENGINGGIFFPDGKKVSELGLKIGERKKVFKKKITFSYFTSLWDKRWGTIENNPSVFYAAGVLSSEWVVRAENILIETIGKEMKSSEDDFWGFTLYDDIAIEARNFITNIRTKYEGVILVGGPMATLAPLHVISHFDGVNYILIGEAEGVLEKHLNFIFEINRKNLTVSEIINRVENLYGFFYEDERIFILKNIEVVNRNNSIKVKFPDNLLKDDFKNGLEVNFTRGCYRNCVFCSHVHGKKFRKMEIENAKKFLRQYKKRISKIDKERRIVINIIDDDILMDKKYFFNIAFILKSEGIKIYGIQTSIDSVLNLEDDYIKRILDMEIFFYEPIFWIGTDAFLPHRIRRLGKGRPKNYNIESVIRKLERNRVKNFHYWIVLDSESNWVEFIEELLLVWEFYNKYEYFDLITTSIFLIPYPYTASYTKNYKKRKKIIVKDILTVEGYDEFDYPIVFSEETEDVKLSFILNPVKNLKNCNLLKERKFKKLFNEIYQAFKNSSYFFSLSSRDKRKIITKIEKKVSKLIFD